MDRNFQRLLDLLTVLQRAQPLTTPAIRERLALRGHEVTARTVQRDLEGLASVYPLVCDDRARPYTWSWRRDAARISLPAMDWPEAVSFQLLSTYLDAALPPSIRDDIEPYVTEARRKLGQQLDTRPLRLWPQRVRVVGQGAPLVPPKVARGVHPTVTEAVLRGVSLSIRYRAYGDSAPRKHRVAPLGLVLAGSVGYVPVRFAGHDDVRTLALHRIERAELDDRPSGIESFDIDRWLAEGALGFGGNQRSRLRLRAWEGVGQLLTETPLADDQRVEDAADGSQQISATVLDTAQLRRWLLSLGARVEVLAPPALRAAMADELARSSRRYERAVPADQYA